MLTDPIESMHPWTNSGEVGSAILFSAIACFGDAPAGREWVAGALFNKGVSLVALNRSEQAVAAHD
ncbi:MAG: hypothetical protein ACREX4_23050 [Gammaproteobacteria bacterium]